MLIYLRLSTLTNATHPPSTPKPPAAGWIASASLCTACTSDPYLRQSQCRSPFAEEPVTDFTTATRVPRGEPKPSGRLSLVSVGVVGAGCPVCVGASVPRRRTPRVSQRILFTTPHARSDTCAPGRSTRWCREFGLWGLRGTEGAWQRSLLFPGVKKWSRRVPNPQPRRGLKGHRLRDAGQGLECTGKMPKLLPFGQPAVVVQGLGAVGADPRQVEPGGPAPGRHGTVWWRRGARCEVQVGGLLFSEGAQDHHPPQDSAVHCFLPEACTQRRLQRHTFLLHDAY
mmetsp:Transcript_37742/g.94584  ORF Transcript_37742/g.94584 Transcript_37742/m.94584 type:complete len:284 (+) Transcript_37742:444-1295(+)